MKQLIISLAAAAALSTLPVAAENWTLGSTTYSVDTLQHYKAGPGTWITVLQLKSSARNQKVFISATDLKADGVEIRTINGSDNLKGNVTIPQMVKNHASDGYTYVAGVNSDLFSATGPIGTTVVNGEIYKTAKYSTAWRAVGQDPESKQLVFGNPSVNFGAKLNGKTEYAPSLVNVPRAEGECIIYTRRWGTATGTTKGEAGIEIALRPADGILYSDRPTVCTVESAPVKNGGNMSIPQGCIVLSSNVAKHIKDLGLLKAGDTYTITPSTWSFAGNAYGLNTSIKGPQVINGGNPVLYENGVELTSSQQYMPNYDSRRPRTGLGTDDSRTMMRMVVVDGDNTNKGVSAGCTAKEFADLMKATGCTNAINFDGGGSSILYTHAFGMLNKPSAGTGAGRAVTTGWFVATKTSSSPELASVEFAHPNQTLKKGDKFTPTIYGYNNAGLLINKNVTNFTLIAPEGLGTVSADGKTLTVTGDGTYRLEAKVAGMKCYIAVRAGNYTANSGVDAPEVAAPEAPVEFYTLQGVRVENPESGIYIRRQGSKVSKIIL